MKTRILLGLMALISFGISVNIYTDLRGYHGGLFDWGNTIFPFDLSLLGEELSTVPFILYNLPDGLWMLSLCLLFLIIWGNRSRVLTWLLLGFTMGIFFEVFQYFKVINGTFDIMDVLIYMVAFVIALIIHFTTKSDKWKIGKHTFYHS